MANKQDETVRVAGVLPGDGKWMMTNSSGIKDQSEVLAFVVLERAWSNGHVAIHVEAIGVDAPEITYTPFPDEDGNYYLIDRPPQEEVSESFLSLAELSGTFVLADTKTHRALTGIFCKPISDSLGFEIAANVAKSMRGDANKIDALPGLAWIHFEISKMFGNKDLYDPKETRKILLIVLMLISVGGPPADKHKTLFKKLQKALEEMLETFDDDFATHLIKAIERIVVESAPLEYQSIGKNRGMSSEQLKASWREFGGNPSSANSNS